MFTVVSLESWMACAKYLQSIVTAAEDIFLERISRTLIGVINTNATRIQLHFNRNPRELQPFCISIHLFIASSITMAKVDTLVSACLIAEYAQVHDRSFVTA